MLPNSRKDVRLIKWHVTGPIEYSKRTLATCIAACGPTIYLRKPFPPIVQDAALGLHVRLCRKYRQAIALAEIGQGDGGDSICRSMFETFLASAFVCRQTIKLKKRNGGKVELFKKKLTQEFRATLYLAHDLIQADKRITQMAEERGLKKMAAAERKAAAPALASLKKRIGDGWAKALKANSCAGLSIEDFSHSVGAHRWYHTVYKIQSGHVHPGEPDRFLTYVPGNPRPQVKWQDGPFEVNRMLWVATGMVGLGMNEFNRLLDKTHQPYINAGVFTNANAEMRRVFRFPV